MLTPDSPHVYCHHNETIDSRYQHDAVLIYSESRYLSLHKNITSVTTEAR